MSPAPFLQNTASRPRNPRNPREKNRKGAAHFRRAPPYGCALPRAERAMSQAEQLSNKITQSLLYEIRYGEFSDQDTLPPEVDLAERFGVSRNIVRECLTKLEREGWISRKRGVGTVINRIVVRAETRIDLNYELLKTLEMAGHSASSRLVSISFVPADAKLAQKLEISEGDPVMRLPRVILANEQPCIFCIDYIPGSNILTQDWQPEELRYSIYPFMKKRCGCEVEISLTEVRAMPVTEEVAQALRVPLTSSLLFLSEVGYDFRSRPVLYSEEYMMDGIIHHMVVRKKM
ncbi:hypothetical protein SDC9_100632 [bioreactor metagenome]|uniref:HTH gntR-type domain-containing protein n=1 Tax=bioreactor metagenome TaxID=1076179 RepID=A0A645AKV5_9ZZZZ